MTTTPDTERPPAPACDCGCVCCAAPEEGTSPTEPLAPPREEDSASTGCECGCARD